MKKIITIIFGLSCIALLNSCKKNYTCECTSSAGGSSTTGTFEIRDTKKNAQDACSAKASASAGGATAYSGCSLK